MMPCSQFEELWAQTWTNRKVWTPKMMWAQKNGIRRKIPWYIRNFWRSVKTFFVPYLSLQCIKLPDDALVDPLGVRGSNLVQKKGMNAENGLRPKKKQKKSRNVPKKRRDVPKKHIQLENDVLADPLELEAQTLSKKKASMPKMVCGPKKKKKKVGTSRKNAGTSRKNTPNWKMTSWPIPWELEAQTLSKRKVWMPRMVCGPKKNEKK